jgi:ABC-2 type transport system permease protein
MISLFRTEFIKATWRLRTLVMAAGLIVLPAVIAFAIHNRSGSGRGRSGGLFQLAQQSGVLIPVAVLSAMSAFLLVLVAGFIAGDAVSGDAASGNLRYLLLRPVSRTRLLLAKIGVSLVLVWAATFLVAAAALGVGVLLFGWNAANLPSGNIAGGAASVVNLGPSELLVRVIVATAYVAFGFTALVAIGTLVSTLTDVPAGAVSAAVGVYIVSEVLDSITDLGSIRYALPTHYMTSWQSIFTENLYSPDLKIGIIVQVAWFAVMVIAALWWFNRKDIRS